MVKKKGKSKRTSLQDKYKIKKRTAETHRKHKKQANRDAAAGKVVHGKKTKKDPGIPNSWPFKADLLKEIQRTRERQQEMQEKAKVEQKTNLRALRDHQAQGGTARTVQELLAQAQASQQEFQAKTEGFVSTGGTSDAVDAGGAGIDTKTRHDNSVAAGQQSRRAYLRELRKVIDAADVILQVLDARDPVSSRIHPSIEDMVRSKTDKKMVLLLNKIDLVPKTAVQGWLTHLRRSVPALAVRTDKIVERKTASKKSANGDDGDDDATAMSTGTAKTSGGTPDVLGMEGLLQLLKNYARVDIGGSSSSKKNKKKTTIVVGVIGYPNVGKSSIINALKRTRAVGVSPKPGFTTSMQEVVLDRDVRLIDSPGVVFDDEAAWLGNCISTETLDDPIPAVERLIQRCDPKSLLLTYKIPAFPPGDVMMFLAMVARSYGRVLKGGIPDKVAAARAVLKDWNGGKIPYYTAPPSKDEGVLKNADATIVAKFAPEFDALDAAVLGSTEGGPDEMDFVQLNSTTTTAGTKEWKGFDDDDDDKMEEDSDDDDDIEQEVMVKSHKQRRQQLAKAEDYDFDDL